MPFIWKTLPIPEAHKIRAQKRDSSKKKVECCLFYGNQSLCFMWYNVYSLTFISPDIWYKTLTRENTFFFFFLCTSSVSALFRYKTLKTFISISSEKLFGLQLKYLGVIAKEELRKYHNQSCKMRIIFCLNSVESFVLEPTRIHV